MEILDVTFNGIMKAEVPIRELPQFSSVTP